jgi:hypothetical protein
MKSDTKGSQVSLSPLGGSAFALRGMIGRTLDVVHKYLGAEPGLGIGEGLDRTSRLWRNFLRCVWHKKA